MEQRILSLEDELKLLKNQIRAVLLDIKESLTSGDWQGLPTIPEPEQVAADQFSEPTGQQPQRVTTFPDSTPGAAQVSTPPDSIDIPDYGGGGPLSKTDEVPRSTRPAQQPGMTSTGHDDRSAGHDDRSAAHPDLLTMIMLTQWLEKATATVGTRKIQELVAIYNATANPSQELKQALSLLTDVYGDNGSQTDKSSLATTMPLLMELDSLLRQPDYPLKSAVISMLVNTKHLETENNPGPDRPRHDTTTTEPAPMIKLNPIEDGNG